MDNNSGAVTRVEYAPSTRFFLRGRATPETRWKTPLPFPVQVVARVEVDRRHLRRQADDRVHLPPRLLGRRRAGVPRLRARRPARHRDVRGLRDRRTARRHRSFAPVARSAVLATHSRPAPGSTRGRSATSSASWEEPDFTRRVLERATRRCSTAPPRRWRLARRPPAPRPARRPAHAARAGCCAPSCTPWTARRREGPPLHRHRAPARRARGGRRRAPARTDRRDLLPPPARRAHHAVGARRRPHDAGSTFTGDYDAYGQPRLQTRASPCPRGRDYRDGYVGLRGTVPGDPDRDGLRSAGRRRASTSRTAWPATTTLRDTERRRPDPRSPLAAVRCWTARPSGASSARPSTTTTGPRSGLPFGQVGDRGALVRTETLAC